MGNYRGEIGGSNINSNVNKDDLGWEMVTFRREEQSRAR